MKNSKPNNSTKTYIGVATIIPCQDLPKMEYQMEEAVDDIAEALMNNMIIGDCKVSKVVQRKYFNEDYKDYYEEIWKNIVCRKLKQGFFVTYKVATPKKIFKTKSGEFTRFSLCDNCFQTNYVLLEDLSELSSVLTDIDQKILEQEWEKQEARKQEK